MSRKLTRFWLVWRENGGAPTYRHHSKASAEAEAQRLAGTNPDSTFLVLKVVGGVSADHRFKRLRFRTSRDPDDGIPF